MNIGINVLCRFNSSRLPGKILSPINDKPLIAYILERLAISKYNANIVVATSSNETDQPIHDYCIQNNITCYRGSLENVSERFLNCAIHHEFNYAVRINGDNLFADPSLIDNYCDLALNGAYDLVSNVPNRTYPSGMSVEVIKILFMREAISNFDEDQYKEHVTLYFYKNLTSGKFKFIENNDLPEAKGLKLAIDHLNDLNLAAYHIKNMQKNHVHYNWKEIVSLYLNNE